MKGKSFWSGSSILYKKKLAVLMLIKNKAKWSIGYSSQCWSMVTPCLTGTAAYVTVSVSIRNWSYFCCSSGKIVKKYLLQWHLCGLDCLAQFSAVFQSKFDKIFVLVINFYCLGQNAKICDVPLGIFGL